jgi:hypothetical protein
MRLRLPPKNRNQGIYWVRYYLDHVDKPIKAPKISKQQEYRDLLLEILSNFHYDNYPGDIQALIDEINRVLGLKRITSAHVDKINNQINILANKYKQE